MLVEECLGVQLGPFHAHPDPAKAATNCGLHYSSKKVARVSCKQCLTLTCTQETLPRVYRTKPTGRLQTTSVHNPINSINGIHKDLSRYQALIGPIHFMKLAPAQKLVHSGRSGAPQSASSGPTPPMNGQRAIKTTPTTGELT